MRKWLFISLVTSGLIFAAGCTNNARMLDNQEQQINRTNQNGTVVENVTQNSTSNSNHLDSTVNNTATKNESSTEITTHATDSATNQTNNEKAQITSEEAKKIALNHAQLTEKEVTLVKVQLKTEDGVQVYDIEFYQNGSTFKEYDYEINAQNGTILDYDFDAENYTHQAGAQQTNATISEAEVKKTVLARINGANESHISYIKLDMDDGVTVYEGKIIYNAQEYEFEINAATGVVISWEVESVYD